jgi:hypothetical protein
MDLDPAEIFRDDIGYCAWCLDFVVRLSLMRQQLLLEPNMDYFSLSPRSLEPDSVTRVAAQGTARHLLALAKYLRANVHRDCVNT